MGVDIGTYRARIGTFAGSHGNDVVTFEFFINFSGGLKTVGSVLFIGMLLIIAGIEINPGPTFPKIMGVDIGTYRARIGTFAGSHGNDVVTFEFFINFSGVLKTVGSVLFIGILLIIAGIEINPGPTFPKKKPKVFATVKYSYTAKNDEQLTLNEGDVVTVKDRKDGNMWKGKLNGRKGLFPKYCVEILQENSDNSDENQKQTRKDDEHQTCTGEQTRLSGASCEDSNQNEVSNHDKVILEQVEDLGLKKWFPRKLTMKTLMTVDPSENVCGTTEFIAKVDLPWIMLKRLLQLNFNWMDFPISPGTNERTGTTTIGSLSSMYDNSDKIEGISPLDIFIIVFECCDPMLKQLLFQKLHLCKLAVPFICRKFYSSESLVYVWPLRSIITEIETETGRSKDSVLDMQTEVICFARFGRPRFSKSKLINGILSDTVTDTFYNKDSPSGKIPRRLTDGYVEMFWLPSIHQTGCRFRTTLTFLNIRGDMDNAIPENISSVISCISHILTAVCDIEYILRNKENAVEIITRFSFVVLVIADVLDPKDIATRTKLSEFIDSVSNNSKTILKVLCTHKKYQERNLVEIIADISALFNEYLEKQLHSPISLKTRISKNIKTPFYTDENDECINSKKDAKKIVKAMTNTSDPDNWVKTITPVQIMSKGISELLKQKYRNKEFSLGDTIAERIKHLRQRQLNQISDPVKLFITILIHNSKSTMFLQYFLGWLKWYFEQRNRTVLPKLLLHGTNIES